MTPEKLVISIVFGSALMVFLVVLFIELIRGVILTRQDYGIQRKNSPNKFWRNIAGQILVLLTLAILLCCAIIAER